MIDPGSEKVSFFAQLRRRGVLRVAASYGAIAWLLVQIAGTLAEPFDLPRWVMRGLVFAAVAGFPVAVALAWFLEFTPQGVAVDREAPGVSRPVTGGLRRYADVAIIGVLLLVVGYLLARQPDVIGLGERATVAVLPFESIGRTTDGAVLATGIAESVLHQLANLQQLDVISRTSSFAFRERAQDAREIGRTLKATYLLEGSVQSDRARLRITTQLIDARTGADVWSMRFDRRPVDIFAVQDEIALQVTRALELTLDEDALKRMRGQGTENLDAYLAYVQARSLLDSDRVVDVQQAIEQLDRATEIDPRFAAAYVAQAEAGLFVAEYDLTEDRQTRFENALVEGRELIERALELDSDDGEAYIVRASMTAYEDLAAAEADYRRGLELSPNAAKGYYGLAVVLYETVSRRDEALAMLDRARKLDPLQPAYDVTRSVFMSYERGDVRGANDLLADVLRRHPDYRPALARMTELRAFCTGQTADAIEYGERALALDPMGEEVRRALLRAYLAVGDVTAAEDVADSAAHESTVRRIPLALYKRDWLRAGEAAYEALARQTVSPVEGVLAVAAIRLHARESRDLERARLALEAMSDVRWEAGRPVLPERPGLREAAIGLADVLIEMGRVDEGRLLLQAIVGHLRRELGEQGRSEFWYRSTYPVALVLLGEREEALAMLQRAIESRQALGEGWYFFEIEPVYDGLRRDPQFEALREAVQRNTEEQRGELELRRADGRVPVRGALNGSGHE
jgi:TolB-like protein